MQRDPSRKNVVVTFRNDSLYFSPSSFDSFPFNLNSESATHRVLFPYLQQSTKIAASQSRRTNSDFWTPIYKGSSIFILTDDECDGDDSMGIRLNFVEW